MRPNPADYGMREVDKDTFYKAMGPLDVHPSPQGPYDREWGYRVEWRIQQSRRLVGMSWNGVYALPHGEGRAHG